MGWALWLAVPVVLTVVAALLTWFRARPVREPRGIDQTLRAHQQFLDALAEQPRSRDTVRD